MKCKAEDYATENVAMIDFEKNPDRYEIEVSNIKEVTVK